jgi:anti-sigma regulatory factor (Ser/Thr protein kinase)
MRSSGSRTCTRWLDDAPPPAAAPDPRTQLLQHRAELVNGRPSYTAWLGHGPDGLRLLSPYVGLLLSTYGPYPKNLMHLRVAVYELGVNAIEHGTPRRRPARLKLELRFLDGAIAGSLQDECTPFDPLAVPVPTVDDLIGARRAHGYGIPMVHRLVDSLTHAYTGTGNRVDFHKRIEA